MTNATYVYFELNGFKYRTNGVIVEGLDGKTWNVTGSLRVVLAARDVFSKLYAEILTEAARELP